MDTADNGQEGIEAFAQKEEGYYHAILMDIQMPVVNGLAAGMNLHVSKPFEIEELMNILLDL